jgi:hypothetical protein
MAEGYFIIMTYLDIAKLEILAQQGNLRVHDI